MSEENHAINDAVTKDSNRFLAFTLAETLFAIPLLEVKEVIGKLPVTPIPQAPAYFNGVLNLRGQIISVIDLRAKLRMPKAEASSESSIVILDLKPCCVGIVVDSIDSVLAVNRQDIAPADSIAHLQNAALNGVAKSNEALVLLLDVGRTLNREDLKIVKNSETKVA